MPLAAVGDRAEDLVAKEFLRDANLTDTSLVDDLNKQYASAGIAPITRGAFFGGESTSLGRGSTVRIVGLQAKPALNGVTGRVMAFNEEKGRFAVRLIDGESILVRAANLESVPTPTEPVSTPTAEDVRDGTMCATRLADCAAGAERVTELGRLDNEAAYAVALRHGLHRGLTSALEDEAREVAARWESGTCVSYLHFISTSLFRGQRDRTDGGFGAVDGLRLSAYLRAEPRGWTALLAAAAAVAQMVATAKLPPPSQLAAHRAGRDCWVFFTLALVHRPVACALLGLDGGAPEAPNDLDTTLGLALKRGVLTEAQADAKTDELARGETTEAQLCAALAPLVAAGAKARAKDAAKASAATVKGAMAALDAAGEARDPRLPEITRDYPRLQRAAAGARPGERRRGERLPGVRDAGLLVPRAGHGRRSRGRARPRQRQAGDVSHHGQAPRRGDHPKGRLPQPAGVPRGTPAEDGWRWRKGRQKGRQKGEGRPPLTPTM